MQGRTVIVIIIQSIRTVTQPLALRHFEERRAEGRSLSTGTLWVRVPPSAHNAEVAELADALALSAISDNLLGFFKLPA